MAGHQSTAVSFRAADVFFKVVAALSTFAGWCSAGMIVVAVAITCQMIIIRFVFNGSTVWQTEAVVYLVVAATLIGLAYVQRLRGHVNVDLIPISLAPKPRLILAVLTGTVSVFIVALMLWYGYDYWHFAWKRGWKSDSVWGVSLWIPYLSLPIGFGLFLLQLISDLLAVVLRIEKPFGLDNS